jgi:hypothetical protein
MLLSCRRLVFTNIQIYFQCMIGTSVESLSIVLILGRTTGLTVRSTTGLEYSDVEELYRLFPYESARIQANYINDRLSEYYKRQVSFSTDIIDAFLGIMNAHTTSNLARKEMTQFYGILFLYISNAFNPHLARSSFLEGLLWSIKIPEENAYVLPHTFPSWSWEPFKAARPANALGELVPPPNMSLYTLQMYEEIDVQIWHQSSRAMAEASYALDIVVL